MTETFEKYYTREQLEELAERREIVGEERIRQAETEWRELIAAVRTEMERGTDPGSEKVRELARQWRGLIEEFTGGNPEIEESLRRMYRDEPNVAADKGYRHDPDMAQYLGTK